VPRISATGSAATAFVLEVFKLSWYLGLQDVTDSNGAIHWGFLSTSTSRFDAEATTVTTFNDDAADPLNIGMAVFAKTALTSGATAITWPVVVDMSDGFGNGTLIATDRVSIVGANIGGTVASNYVCVLTYKLTEVGIQEYVGIVQSQQG